MSLQSELTRLQDNVTSISSSKEAIMAALASKGVTVPAGATLHDVPNLIGQINGSAPEPENPSITFRFANSQFAPTSAEQIAEFGDASRWERVTGSQYNDWKFTANGTSISKSFFGRFTENPFDYHFTIASGITTVLATSNLDRLVDISQAFANCDTLYWTPDFNPSSVSNCNSAFFGCTNVTAYQLYVKLSSIPNIEYNKYTFDGVLDANLIPSDWGGSA